MSKPENLSNLLEKAVEEACDAPRIEGIKKSFSQEELNRLQIESLRVFNYLLLLRKIEQVHPDAILGKVDGRAQLRKLLESISRIVEDIPALSASNATSTVKANGKNGVHSHTQRLLDWLGRDSRSPGLPAFQKAEELKYGENPHQGGWFAPEVQEGTPKEPTLADTERREMSFNNHVDADSALELCKELTLASRLYYAPNKIQKEKSHVCVFVKHTSPCGVGVGIDPIETYRKAYIGDPNASMGGIVCMNFSVTAEIADAVTNSLSRWGKERQASGFFVEVWLAPEFQKEAIEKIHGGKPWGKRVRLLELGDLDRPIRTKEFDFRKIRGGILLHSRDHVGLNEDQWKVATKRKPTEFEIADMRLAWLIAKHTKSNAISICKDGMLIGNGAGQMSRVMSCRIATWLAKENKHEDKLKGSVAASDAFFPFPDGPNILIDAGVTAIIQPGGSKNDEKVIAACDERGVAMIFTGTRHFKH